MIDYLAFVFKSLKVILKMSLKSNKFIVLDLNPLGMGFRGFENLTHL